VGGERSIVMSVSDCSEHISKTKRLNFTKFSARNAYGRGKVLLWRHSNMLCTSGFMDEFTISYNWQHGGVTLP